MPKRQGVRTGKQKQGQVQVQVQLTERRREGSDALDTNSDTALLAGALPVDVNQGTLDEADGDDLLDDGDETAAGEPGSEFFVAEEAEEEPDSPRRFTSADLIGSRPPRVLFRLNKEGDDIAVRRCAAPTPATAAALEMMQEFLRRCFQNRASLTETEWAELLGDKPSSLTCRLLLLLRLAIKANDKVSLEVPGASFTPRDIGLERFATKFVALPDGTPFSLRLLLLDQRGRERSDHFFDQVPDAVKLLALRRALQVERAEGAAVSDNEFRDKMQQALEGLLGASVPKPTEDQIRRRLRDNFARKGLRDVFPNQKVRQRDYDRARAEGPA
jgi:hypothetical protein